jgi:outer membrane protein assembly factor BamD
MNDYPDSQWAKAARYQIAHSDAKRSPDAPYDQKVTESAIQEFQDFVKDNPDAELSQDAKGQIQGLREKEAENNFLIAKFYEKQKKFQAAKIYYNTIVENYQNTSWAPRALEKLRELNVN